MIETGFKLGLGIAAAGVALWVGSWVVAILIMVFGELMFGNHGGGNR